MPDLAIATAPLKNSRTWTNGTTSWASFVKAAAKPADRKECGNYLFGVLRGASRTKETILSRSAVTLDADKARADLPEKVAALGCAALVHTTYSHTTDTPRYRVSLPLSRWVTPDEYRILTDWLMDRLGRDQFDKGSREPERYMFRPSTPDPETYECWEYRGPWLDVDQALDDADLMGPVSAEPVTPAVESDTRQAADAEEVAERVTESLKDLDMLAALPVGDQDRRGEGWDSGTFRAACTLVRAANCCTGYTLADALADFTEHCPTDSGFGEDRRAAKWADAVKQVAGGVLPTHRNDPSDDFDALPPEPGATATGLLDRFPRCDLGSLLDPNRPEREWVVGGLIPAGASVSIVAPAGEMKSLLTFAAVLAVARGDREFAGLVIPRPRLVMYVDAELTEDDLADRLRDLGVQPEGLDRLIYLHLPAFPPLDTEKGGADLVAVAHAYGLKRGDVIVLDSLQRVVDGPENDSDTFRAYYRHTALALKRCGFTVIRTDNSGKATGRGARGSSSKRDDVDLEWRQSRDRDAATLSLTPDKARLAGVEPLVFAYATDDEGLLRFTTVGDPFRDQVTECGRWLDELGVAPSAGERVAGRALAAGGRKVLRNVLRVAIRDRRSIAEEFGAPTEKARRASTARSADDDRAEPTRRGPAR